MNTVSTQPVPIMVTPISNSKESMCTIMKPLAVDSSQELFLWILNPEQWTLLELDLSVNYLDLITSFSDKLVLVTIGPKDITPKVLNLSTLSSMSSEKKLKVAIASKVSKSPTLSVVVLVLVWVHSLSPKSEKNILTELWKLSPFSHRQKYLILLLNLIMLHFQFINSSKMLMKYKLLITKPFMISVSEHLNLPPQPMVILTILSPLPCLVLPAQSVSQVNLTPISENSLSTLFLSQDSISS